MTAAELFNEGLEPGVRVSLDNRSDQTATVCFTELDAAYTRIRLDCTGQHVWVASWRLDRLA